jgi:hypothetical protein
MNGQSWDKNYIRHNTQNDDKQNKNITKKTQKMNNTEPTKKNYSFFLNLPQNKLKKK